MNTAMRKRKTNKQRCPGEKLKCKICNQSFKTVKDVKIHISHHLDEETCNVCGKQFTDKVLLQKHLLSHIHTTKSAFQCSVKDCDKQFKLESSLKHHLIKHAGDLPLSCEFCEKSYMNSSDLEKHTESHSNQKCFECNICGLYNSTKGHLEQHMRIHTKLRPFKCDVCSKTFSQKPNLTRHSRIHSGERPYKCTICGKCFIESGKLTKHYRVHAGHKNYQCTECGRTFAEKRNLTQHLLIHSGEKPNKCSICDRSFRYVSDLREHKLVHSDVKSFLCSICGHSFKSNRNLKKHVKTLHNNINSCHIVPVLFEAVESANNFNSEHQHQNDHSSVAVPTEPETCPVSIQLVPQNTDLKCNISKTIGFNIIASKHEDGLFPNAQKPSSPDILEPVSQPTFSTSSNMSSAGTSTNFHQLTRRECQSPDTTVQSVMCDTFDTQYSSNQNNEQISNFENKYDSTTIIVYPEQMNMLSMYNSIYSQSNCVEVEVKNSTLLDISNSTVNSQYSQAFIHSIYSNTVDVCINDTSLVSDSLQNSIKENTFSTELSTFQDQWMDTSANSAYEEPPVETSSSYSTPNQTVVKTCTQQCEQCDPVLHTPVQQAQPVRETMATDILEHDSLNKRVSQVIGMEDVSLVPIDYSSVTNSESADLLSEKYDDSATFTNESEPICLVDKNINTSSDVKLGTEKISNQLCFSYSNFASSNNQVLDSDVINQAEMSSFNDEDASNALLLLSGCSKSAKLKIEKPKNLREFHTDSDTQSPLLAGNILSEKIQSTVILTDSVTTASTMDTACQSHGKSDVSHDSPACDAYGEQLYVDCDEIYRHTESNGSPQLNNIPIPQPCQELDNPKENCEFIPENVKAICIKTSAAKTKMSKAQKNVSDMTLNSKKMSTFPSKRTTKWSTSKCKFRQQKIHLKTNKSCSPTTCSKTRFKQSEMKKTTHQDKLFDLFVEKVENNNFVGKEEEVPKKKMVQCYVCQLFFQHNGALTQHLRTHNSDNDLIQCEICSKTFCKKSNLNQHMKIHLGLKEFSCEICGQCFLLRHSLISHQKVHSDVRPFQCDLCPRCFKFQRDLINHKRIHSGARPYQCSECGRMFSLNSSLNRHFRTHSGILPYKCKICGRKFSQNGNMHQHMRTHEGPISVGALP